MRIPGRQATFARCLTLGRLRAPHSRGRRSYAVRPRPGSLPVPLDYVLDLKSRSKLVPFIGTIHDSLGHTCVSCNLPADRQPYPQQETLRNGLLHFGSSYSSRVDFRSAHDRKGR
jgi:hypothetical protein